MINCTSDSTTTYLCAILYPLGNGQEIYLGAPTIIDAAAEALVIISNLESPPAWGGITFEEFDGEGNLRRCSAGVIDASGGFSLILEIDGESDADHEERMHAASKGAHIAGAMALWRKGRPTPGPAPRGGRI